MNTSAWSRLLAAVSAAVTTASLLVGVVSLGEPATPPAMPPDTTLAHQPAAAEPPTVVLASNEPR